jgi:hypothetical protein
MEDSSQLAFSAVQRTPRSREWSEAVGMDSCSGAGDERLLMQHSQSSPQH